VKVAADQDLLVGPDVAERRAAFRAELANILGDIRKLAAVSAQPR
jgi:hypothetical protein